MNIKNKNNIKKISSSIILLCFLTAFLLIFVVLFYFTKKNTYKDQVSSGKGTLEQETINYGPPSTEEKKMADDSKTSIIQNEYKRKTISSAEVKKVTPIISNATADNISAYVIGVFEDDGLCTATFKQNNTTIHRVTGGFANASYTQCSPIKPDLPSGGRWLVTIFYKSSLAEGSSEAKEMQVQ